MGIIWQCLAYYWIGGIIVVWLSFPAMSIIFRIEAKIYKMGGLSVKTAKMIIVSLEFTILVLVVLLTVSNPVLLSIIIVGIWKFRISRKGQITFRNNVYVSDDKRFLDDKVSDRRS